MATGGGAARIAVALRARIVGGELKPGDRVPSTRELTREWGVAMATATRALATLRQEGLTRPVVGVGTVVAETSATARTRPRSAADPRLDAESIVATAVRVADAEGLDAVSMRRVASDLGVATMSLYRHVGDKDDLLERMQDVVLGEWRPPDPPPADWRSRLEVAGVALWVAFRAHPWLAQAMSLIRPAPRRGAIVFSEWNLEALDGQPIGLQDAFDVHMILFNFVRGVALNIEDDVRGQAATGLDAEEWMDARLPALRTVVDGGPYPRMRRVLDEGYDLRLDHLTRAGLSYLLDGVAMRFARDRP